jgi:hypothetical protein
VNKKKKKKKEEEQEEEKKKKTVCPPETFILTYQIREDSVSRTSQYVLSPP